MENIFLKHTVADLNLMPEALVCPPTISVSEAIGKMQKANLGSIVIVENRTVLGIFTERDVMNKVALKLKNIEHEQVKDVMNASPMTVRQTDPLQKAVMLMQVGNFRHVPVVNDKKELITMLSIKDILTFILSKFS